MSYATKAEAQAKCEALLSQLSGEGWEMYINDNMGWYYYATNGLLSVHESDDGNKYEAMLSESQPGGGSYTFTNDETKGYSKTPDAAVRRMLKMARKEVEKLMEILTVAEIASDQRPKSVKYGPCPKCMAKKGKRCQ